MKTCKNCGSVAFDDMEMCFDCMSSFTEPVIDLAEAQENAVARLEVALTGYFKYELLLNKLEGCSLSVGSASENAIVIPQGQVSKHLLDVFYARGHIWVESADPSLQVTVDECALYGTVCVEPGAKISAGEAKITILEA